MRRRHMMPGCSGDNCSKWPFSENLSLNKREREDVNNSFLLHWKKSFLCAWYKQSFISCLFWYLWGFLLLVLCWLLTSYWAYWDTSLIAIYGLWAISCFLRGWFLDLTLDHLDWSGEENEVSFLWIHFSHYVFIFLSKLEWDSVHTHVYVYVWTYKDVYIPTYIIYQLHFSLRKALHFRRTEVIVLSFASVFLGQRKWGK